MDVLFVLRFYGPVNPMRACRAQLVYPNALLLGRLSPLSSKPVLCTFLRQKLITALHESAQWREWPQKIRSISTKNSCRPGEGRTHNLLIASRTRIQLSHRGLLNRCVQNQTEIRPHQKLRGEKVNHYSITWPSVQDKTTSVHRKPKHNGGYERSIGTRMRWRLTL